jgi:seryl-tRNA synthetase
MPGSALIATPAAGVYLYPGDFEAVVDGLSSALTSSLGMGAQQSMRVPPVIARSVIEKVGYQESFPHLLGTVFARTTAATLAESDLVLLPAGCYGVYPAYEGARLAEAAETSIEATCFRQEGSAEVGRLRSFRMREFVRLGAGDDCRAWRDSQLAAAQDWLANLGLDTGRAVASDPFFGGGNRLMRMLQMEQELKIELLAAVGPGQVQAIASGNCHKDQFGRLFAISDWSGGIAHTACVAFGYERLALALIQQHGENPRRWPDVVKEILSLGALE